MNSLWISTTALLIRLDNLTVSTESGKFQFCHPVVLVCNKQLFKYRQELMYITLFIAAACIHVFVHLVTIDVINLYNTEVHILSHNGMASIKFVQHFYEIYINGLKTAELGRNMLPQ
jgi:hypothetical protein